MSIRKLCVVVLAVLFGAVTISCEDDCGLVSVQKLDGSITVEHIIVNTAMNFVIHKEKNFVVCKENLLALPNKKPFIYRYEYSDEGFIVISEVDSLSVSSLYLPCYKKNVILADTKNSQFYQVNIHGYEFLSVDRERQVVICRSHEGKIVAARYVEYR